MKIIYRLLASFRFARKRLGGTWYYVRQLDVSGFVGTTEYWTQTPGADETILKEENYSLK